jgi:hypothetical protein
MDIYKSNGDLFTSLADGTTTNANDAPVILAGRNFAGYGKVLNENTIRLAENFASDGQPVGPVVGQCWYNTAHKILYLYKGTTDGWKPLASESIQLEAPLTPAVGDLWWDIGTDQLKMYSGTGWKVIGPDFEKNWGESGVIPFIVTDNNTIPHVVLKIATGGTTSAIISQDGEFTPSPAMAGFNTIKNGININSATPNFNFHGISTDSKSLGGQLATNYVRKNQDSIINANVTINGITSISASNVVNGTISTNADTKVIRIENKQQNKDVEFFINYNGTPTRALTINGDTGETQVGPSFTSTQPSTEQGIAHRGYVTDVRNTITSEYTSAISTTKTELTNTINAINTRLITAETTVAGHGADIRTINTSLETKASINAPQFIGTPTAETPNIDSNDGKLATTSFVNLIKAQIIAELQQWATQRDFELKQELTADINPKAPLINPELLGSPKAPTAPALASTSQIATTEFVTQALVLDDKWGSSKKTVSGATPQSSDGDDGDFWFVLDA